MKQNPPSPAATPHQAGTLHTRRLKEDLLARIETCLANDREAVELQVERSHLLAELGRSKEAADSYRQATRLRTPKYPLTTRAYSILPFTGEAAPVTALLIVAPEWGNAPFRRYLDPQTFLTLQIIADFHDLRLPLPSHQLVINCISDADSCQASLQAAAGIVAATKAPVINSPDRVLLTGRESGARLLGHLPGIRTPRIVTASRELLASGDAAAELDRLNFTFPLLLRAPGYHNGLHFVRVESAWDLPTTLASLPGDNFAVLEYLDARGTDGFVRKYRAMMVDGKLYPAHVAISPDWKVHYFSAAMAGFPEHRAEDATFLENMPAVLGPALMGSLKTIQDALKLDYAGIDFGIGRDGELLLFEANATMNVRPPQEDEIWAYRRPAVRQIENAVRAMLGTRSRIE